MVDSFNMKSLYSPQEYSLVTIEKKSKIRKIYKPNYKISGELKLIKDQLFLDYSEELKAMKYQFAYLNDKSIINNATIHVGNSFMIKLDIKNYFDSCTFQRVFGFLNKKYDRNIAKSIAQMCCYRSDGKHVALAQGSPASPVLSNLVSKQVDVYMVSFLNKVGQLNYDIFYSRYSDDMTISTDSIQIYKQLEALIHPHKSHFSENFLTMTGFNINQGKIRFLNYRSKKVVTGIVVNEKLNISKKDKKDIKFFVWRASIDFEDALLQFKAKYPKPYASKLDGNLFIQILEGKVEYYKHICGENNTYKYLDVLMDEVRKNGR